MCCRSTMSFQAAALYNYTSAIQGQGLELSSLKGAVHHYQQAADALQSACTGDSPSVDEKTCNGKLGLAERQFLIEDGLPGRPWFKHILQAPGMDLGYAAEAFPGIQQALDDGDLGTAEQQVRVAAERVQAAAAFLSVSRNGAQTVISSVQ
jgi:N-acetylated-alpha-linked acidic dipeptidase